MHIDNKENIEWLKQNGKLKMPTTVLSGERCFLAKIADQMGAELAENFKTGSSSHFLNFQV